MPHFKCIPCKTRLFDDARSADLVGDLCPGCGSVLEPVGELTEIVGFRSIKSRVSAPLLCSESVALPAIRLEKQP